MKMKAESMEESLEDKSKMLRAITRESILDAFCLLMFIITCTR